MGGCFVAKRMDFKSDGHVMSHDLTLEKHVGLFVLRSKCETLNNVEYALHLNITQVSFYACLVSSNRSNHIYPK
jgi:hypothetical protein